MGRKIGRYEISTGEELFERFQQNISELGFTSMVAPEQVARNVRDASEMDYDELNQYWSNWVDAQVADGIAAIHLLNEDWEDYL